MVSLSSTCNSCTGNDNVTSTSTTGSSFMSVSNHQHKERPLKTWSVDICAAVIADRPPKLPLREELPSLGFEVILGASGVGQKAAQDESKQAVEAFRRELQYHDLQKRRLFPKCKRRILEKIEARKQMEENLAVPHACSYESYEMKLWRIARRGQQTQLMSNGLGRRSHSSGGRLPTIHDATSATDNHDSSSSSATAATRRTATMLSERLRNHHQVTTEFPDLLFLAPDHRHTHNHSGYNNNSTGRQTPVSSKQDDSSNSSRLRRRSDYVPQVFGAFDNLDTDDATHSGRSGSCQHEEQAIHSRRQQTDDYISIQEEKKDDDPTIHSVQKEHEQEKRSFQGPPLVTLNRRLNNTTENGHPAQSHQHSDRNSTNPFDSTGLCHSGGDLSVKTSLSNETNGANTHQKQLVAANHTTSVLRLKTPDWMSSAKNALENFSSEVLKVTSCDKRHASAAQPTRNDQAIAVEDPVSRLFRSLTTCPDIATIQSVLAEDAALAHVRRETDGRLPLHVLADQCLPIRKGETNSSSSSPSLIDTLLLDVGQVKQAVMTVVDAHPGACTEFDKKLDLPVHLMARRLMEWEATWYEAIYHAAATQGETEHNEQSTEVSELYHAMSETVERLLVPLITMSEEKAVLCQAPGGMGTILPLHIASIFTVSVRTMRWIVEAYPEASRIPCDLGILQTFVPDECLALELHDNLSTDLPKWELNQGGENDNQMFGDDKDRIRRSDLLFAYNPIEPHRFEKARLSRFELQIQFDATVLQTKPSRKLDAANQNVWIWMCSFCEPESGRASYAGNVRRIVRNLTGESFQHLKDLVVTTPNNIAVKQANEDCVAILQHRSDEIQAKGSALGAASLPSDVPVVGQVTIEEICRAVFHIPELPFPSSFIILPYKLRRSENGSMSLEDPEQSSKIAALFAKSLIGLTEPETIQDMLRGKWEQFDHARQITRQNYERSAKRLREKRDSFLALYRNAVGYFYVLDKHTGLPDLSAFQNASYPHILTNPTETISLLFPLMMMGMLQMRGDKAIPKLVKICSDKSLLAISPSLVGAAQLLQQWNYSQPHSDGDTKHAIHQLVTAGQGIFPMSRSNTETPIEWSSEISVLRTLIEALYQSQEKEFYRAGKVVPKDKRNLTSDDEKTASPMHKNVSFADDDGYLQDQGQKPEAPVIDVIDLTKKMDTLSLYKDIALNANGGPALHEDSPDSPDSPELFFQQPEITDVTGLSEFEGDVFGSRYSPLFGTFAMEHSIDQESKVETHGEVNERIQVWNEIDRVWEEVEWQLKNRAETLCEDSQILQVKVDLAKQAKMLSSLRKKVTHLRDKERRFATRGVEIVDLTNHDIQALGNHKNDPRSLFLRLGDLEGRLVCDEIAVQHLAMETYTVEHEGDSMLSSYGRSSGSSSFRQRPIPLPAPIGVERKQHQMLHQTSGSTISFSDESSFRPYGKKSAPTSRSSDQVIELDTSSSSYSQVRSLWNEVPHDEGIRQVSVGLNAVSRSFLSRRNSSDDKAVQGLKKERKTSIIESSCPPSERLLITRQPLGALGMKATLNSSEESKAQLSSTVMTQDTVVGTVSLESRCQGSMIVVAENECHGQKSQIEEKKSRNNLLLLKRMSRDSRSDETPPLCSISRLRLGPRAQQLATRLKRHSLSTHNEQNKLLHDEGAVSQESFGEEKESHDPSSSASNASSIFRLQTIHVPQFFSARDYSGLTASRSSRSHSDLASEIDNLILRYTSSEEAKTYQPLQHDLVR